jgi:hypothetical protein
MAMLVLEIGNLSTQIHTFVIFVSLKIQKDSN